MISPWRGATFYGVVDDASKSKSGHFERSIPELDARGVSLARLTLSFTGPSVSPDVLSATNISRTANDWWMHATLLPAKLARGATYVRVRVHSHGPEHTETHWELRFYIAPDSDPPRSIRQDAIPGLYPDNLIELFTKGGITGEVEMSSHASYLILDSMVKHLWDSAQAMDRSSDGYTLITDQVSWSITNSTSLNRVTMSASGHDELSWLEARGEHRAALGESIKDEVDSAIWSEVKRCLDMDHRFQT